jgi:hypothetical protein
LDHFARYPFGHIYLVWLNLSLVDKFDYYYLQPILVILLLEISFSRPVLSFPSRVEACCDISTEQNAPLIIVTKQGLRHMHRSTHFIQTITHITCANAGHNLANHRLHRCQRGRCEQKYHEQEVLVEEGEGALKRVWLEKALLDAGCEFQYLD